MSYSISVKGGTKAEALHNVRMQFREILHGQPIHTKDHDQAVAAAEAMINVLADDDTKEVRVQISGSLSWQGDTGKERISSANVSASAGLWDKNPPVAKDPSKPQGSDQGGA